MSHVRLQIDYPRSYHMQIFCANCWKQKQLLLFFLPTFLAPAVLLPLLTMLLSFIIHFAMEHWSIFNVWPTLQRNLHDLILVNVSTCCLAVEKQKERYRFGFRQLCLWTIGDVLLLLIWLVIAMVICWLSLVWWA